MTEDFRIARMLARHAFFAVVAIAAACASTSAYSTWQAAEIRRIDSTPVAVEAQHARERAATAERDAEMFRQMAKSK